MMSLVRFARRLAVKVLGLAVAAVVLAGSPAMAQDGPGVSPGFFQRWFVWGEGTLSYGGDAVYPGYPGFGLSFHPGYGYGGRGLGTGALGGYPFYGGPGYPHPTPVLRRCGGITPFLFYGGPDYPRVGYSNYFTEVGPLVVREPVAIITPTNSFGYTGNFGQYTGTLPYPDSYFAPFVEALGAGLMRRAPRRAPSARATQP